MVHLTDDGTVTITASQVPAVVPVFLTAHPSKRALYAVDTFFRESWEDLVLRADDRARELCHAHTLLLLKPDAVVGRRLHAALDWLAAHEFSVVAALRVAVDRFITRALWQYQWNAATRDRRDNADVFMSACDCLLLLLRTAGAEPATTRLTRLKGHAEPGRCLPGQLRHALRGSNHQLNGVHAADEPADFVRELGVYLPHETRLRLLDRAMLGHDGEPEARTLAGQLATDVPPEDLSLDGALHALAASAAARAGHPARDLESLIAAIRAGRSRDWRTLIGLAEECHVPVSRWQRIVVGTELAEPSIAGVAPLIPDLSNRAGSEPGSVTAARDSAARWFRCKEPPSNAGSASADA